MSPIHVIALLARLFAIALMLIAIRDLVAALSVADDSFTTQKLIPLYAAAIASIVAAAALWVFPLTIARKIYPVRSESAAHDALTSNELYSLGFIILGAYLLFYVVSDAIYWLVLVVLGNRDLPGQPVVTLESKAAMITTAFEFVIALFLIFGANGLAKMIKRVRQ